MRLWREGGCEHGRRSGVGLGEEGGLPGTGLADPYPWTSKVFPQTLVVLGEATELKLGHRLLVRTRIHGSSREWRGRGGRCCYSSLEATCATGAGRAKGERVVRKG